MPVNLPVPQVADLHAVPGVRIGVAMAGIRKANRRDLVVFALDEGTQVAGVFTSSKRALPLLTVMMMAVSDFARHWGWAALLLVAATVTGFVLARRGEAFRERTDALFLRLPVAVTLAVAAAVLALPWQFTHPAFGGWLIWTGLAPDRPLTADFEPFFPWFAPFLAGLATGRLLSWANLWPRLALPDTALVRRLAWPGRHSLAIYLVHQPVLIGLVAGATWAAAHLR